MPSTQKSGDNPSEFRRDPYQVLGVSADATHRQIKSAYRKLALKYHPDKNANDPKATEMFKEITFSYNILSDPEKRRQYDSAGFEAVESDRQELELDLSSLGTVNIVFAALFSKLGVPIKTAVSATLLEDALFGRVTVSPLPLGQPLLRKVDKHSAHFYSVTITEEDSRGGLVCRVQSDKGKFKLLYFEPEDNGGLSLVLQPAFSINCMPCYSVSSYDQIAEFDTWTRNHEDSTKTGKITSAGMYFLGFPVCRLHCTVNSSAAEKDTDAVLFKKLDRIRPSEVTELKAGTHVFAVYGDNFFKSVSYTIEALCAAPYVKEKESLSHVEAQLLTKRAQLSKFESEHREVVAQYTEMTSRFTQEMKVIDNLLKQKSEIHAVYTATQMKQSSSKSKKICVTELQEGNSKETKRSNKKWFNIHLKGR